MPSSETDWVSGEESDRAWQAMLDGHYEDALRMQDSFVQRNGARWLRSRGTTRLLLGDAAGAETDFRTFRDRPCPGKFPIPDVGTAIWLQGRHEEACEDWAYEISRRRSGVITHCDEAGGVEVPALLWWASAHPSLEVWRKLAVEELRDRDRRNRRRKDYGPGPLRRWERWPGVLAPFLAGESGEDALRPVIQDSNPFLAGTRCKACFYLGARRLDAGDLSGYRYYLELAIGEGGYKVREPEYCLARAELLAVGQ